MPAIFFGDAEYDIKTAKNFNLDFIFISGWSDFSTWKETVKRENIKSVEFLKDLII
jgi:phosphoglycolate phosphatase-like HAD superfamily hydrolase